MKQLDPNAVWQSRFATYARSLEPSRLRALRLDETTVATAEVVVSICKLIADDANPQPWLDRIGTYFENIEKTALGNNLELLIEDIQWGKAETWLENVLTNMEGGDAKSWVERFRSDIYRDFTMRLLGAAQYRLLTQALSEDAAVVALALRRIIRALMPFAVAWSDSVGMLTKDQLKAKSKSDFAALNAVNVIIEIDKLFGEKVLAKLPMELTAATSTDLITWTPESTAGLMAQFRSLVKEASAKRVERANMPLLRKIQGARAALQHSEDGTSQAANSLIELIDRIMREAFPQKDVVFWIDANLPDYTELTYIDKETRKPTKLGEALCFIYGGGTVAREANEYDSGEGPSLIHELIARTFVLTRNRLQKIKHADTGTPEEREQLLTLFSALEGALMLGLSVAKLSASPELPAA